MNAPAPAPATAPGPAILARDLWFSYDDQPALREVNLAIQRGEFVSIIGPNGGGKTTLLKLMLGLLRPTRGEVRVLGLTPSAARKRIGYMPQHVQLDPSFPVTALEVVLMGRLGCGLPAGPYRRRDREAALASLEEVEAASHSNRPFFSLSGGQRQRVLIARALASEPEVLLLDEPTASLDPRVQDDLYELLHRLNEHATVVLVSHDISTVSQHVRKVICVNRDAEIHDTAAIGSELASLLFLGGGGRKLVRHDTHGPEE